MGMPRDLVLVRHGQSEANIAQKGFKSEEAYELPAGFIDRHDSEMLLTPLGEWQAEMAGEWLRREFPRRFDHYHVSSLTRTQHTAGRLGLKGAWVEDDRLRERDWGEIASLGDLQHKAQYPNSYRLMKQNKWYWCPPGGESLGTGVRLRWERLLNSMHREMDGDTFIGVAHGETIEVGRVILERMTVSEWVAQEHDPNYKLANTQILHYTRIDPETGEDAKQLRWRRSICPWDESKSWFGGEWQKFEINRTFTDEQLLAHAEGRPRLYPHLTQVATVE